MVKAVRLGRAVEVRLSPTAQLGFVVLLISAAATCRDEGPVPQVPVGIMWPSGASGAMVEDTIPLVVHYHDALGKQIGWSFPAAHWASSDSTVVEITSDTIAIARDTGVVQLTAITVDVPIDTVTLRFEVVPRWRGRLVWDRAPSSGVQSGVAVLELPGHQVRQLPDLGYPGAGSGDPDLSSDGRFVAAIASRPTSPLARVTIYVVDLVTGAKTAPFDSLQGSQFHPVWFPGDTLLAFLADLSGAYEVYTAGPDGSRRQQRTQLGQRIPPSFAVTPDGHLIIALRIGSPYVDLYETTLSGTILHRITDSQAEEYRPAVSPDGGSLAYQMESQVWTSTRDGSNARRLLPELRVLSGYTPFPSVVRSGEPSWTADSRFVIVSWNPDTFITPDPPSYYSSLGEIYAVRVADQMAIRMTRSLHTDAAPFFR
jgi:hypothetical protein